MKFQLRMRRGFSMIELMASLAVGSLVLVLAAAMLGHSGDGYRQIGGKVASEREARAALTQLAEDLSSASFHHEKIVEKSPTAWPVDRLGFLALQPADAQSAEGRIGDLCAVQYSVADLIINGKPMRCLMRGVRESDETFRSLRSGGPIDHLFATQPGRDEPIAFGVVSFSATPQIRTTDGRWGVWQSTNSTGPEAIEIQLVVVRRDLAARMVSAADWDGENRLLGNFSDVAIHQDLEIYRATLPFGSHARR